jgi:hypothetical protein
MKVKKATNLFFGAQGLSISITQAGMPFGVAYNLRRAGPKFGVDCTVHVRSILYGVTLVISCGILQSEQSKVGKKVGVDSIIHVRLVLPYEIILMISCVIL